MKASASALGLLVLGWSSVLTAQPTARFALSWNGPPSCPTAENVQARVDALLGGGANAASVADVRASGQVERVDNGFRLVLNMGVGSTPSSRVFEARTCDELAGAAAIAIALLARSVVEGTGAPSTTEDTAAPSNSGDAAPAVPAPPAAPTPATTQHEPPEESSRSRLRFVLDAPVGVAVWGSLPSVGFGLGAAIGLRWKALRVTANGELWQPQTDSVSGFGTRYTLQSGRAQACLTQAVHDLELGPCIGATVQRLTGEGLDSPVFTAKLRSSLWVSGSGGLFASLPLPGFEHLRFFGEASVLVSPMRPRFTIEQLGPVHEPAMAAPRLDLGTEWIF